MKNLPFGWIIAAVLLSLSAYPLLTYTATPIYVSISTVIILGLAWLFVLLQIFRPEAMQKAGASLQEIRVVPTLAMLLSLMLLLVILMLWGIIILPEFSLFTSVLYFFLLAILWGWGSQADARKAIGAAFERSRAANAVIFLLSFLLIFAAIELTMRFTTIYPDGFAVTLQFTTWYERYYTPLNEFGNRGYEARSADAGQKTILVIGDSYAAGHGINDIDDVFAYQAEAILGNDYIVNLNAGIGISPSVEKYLSPYPVQPDILVLSHFINDIEHTGIPGIETYLEYNPNAFVRWFTDRYFLFSFVYWHSYIGPQMVSSYADELLAAYDDAEKWAEHQARLQEFVDYANEREIPLLVIVWPTLNDMDLSLAANQRVENFFREAGTIVVDIRPSIEPIPIPERMINDFDAHPSLIVNRRVAEALAAAIQALGE